MRKLIVALSAVSLAAAPAMAQNGKGHAYGHEPKVCLLTFSSASQFGADAAVTKAQYVPLSIAEKLTRDTTTQGIAYYGFGDLSATDQARIDFYYPNGSLDPQLGVTENSDTQTLCNAFMDFAASNDTDTTGDTDSDDNDD